MGFRGSVPLNYGRNLTLSGFNNNIMGDKYGNLLLNFGMKFQP